MLRQTFLAVALTMLLAGQAGAAVTVYGQGTYTDEYLELSLFADIDTTPLVSYGIKISYDTDDLSSDPGSISAVKNSAAWYFGRASNRYPTPNADPDVSTPGAVVIVGGKCDIDNPTAGVIGNGILLATITFTRLGSSLPAMALFLGKGGDYANFVQTDGLILDASLRAGNNTIGSISVEESTVSMTTAAVTAITSASASCGGTVVSNSGGAITERGLCWSYTIYPTLLDNTITGSAPGSSFTSSITGLTQGNTYHVRSYAVNSSGTSYGQDRQFSTLSVVDCPDPSDSAIILENVTFESGTECICTATQSITAGPVIVRDGAILTFNAPLIRTLPGFNVENGAIFRTNQ